MAEAVRLFTQQDGTLNFADGGGVAAGNGGYSAAGALQGPHEYEVDFDDGDLGVTFPRRTVAHYKTRARTKNPPTLRYGEDELGSLTFSAKHRDSANAVDETLVDLLLWAAGMAIASSINTHWESTSASTLGAGDADVRTVAAKWTILDEGDVAHTKLFAFNFVELGVPQIGEDVFNNISLSAVIHDRVENCIAA